MSSSNRQNDEKTHVYLSAEDFLAGIQCTPIDFEVPGLGVVKVRSLSSTELNQLGRKHQEDGFAMTMACIRIGLVLPVLSEDQFQQLYDGSAKYALLIGTRIMEISGAGDQVQLEKKVGSG